MAVIITNNPDFLTESESEILKTAVSFVYFYSVGEIFVFFPFNLVVFWNCSNTIAAKKYLEDSGIKEILH